MALVAFLPCLLLTFLAPLGLMPGWLTGIAGGVAFVAFAAMDPNQQGFWYHRRLRPIGTVAALVAGFALGLVLPHTAWIPVVVAAGIVHVHQRRTASLVARGLEDVEGLKLKLLTYEAVTKGAAAESARDIRTKAG